MTNTGSATYTVSNQNEGLSEKSSFCYDKILQSEWATNTLEQGVTVTETASDNQI